MGEGRYDLVMPATAMTAALGDHDIWEVAVPANTFIIIKEFSIFQTSEFADAAEEILPLECRIMTATVTTGNGTTRTAEKKFEGQAASGVTAKSMNTTIATTSGSNRLKKMLGWNVRIPYEKVWLGELEIWVPPSTSFIISSPDTVDDDIAGMVSLLSFEEHDFV
jgi:hypothetical protein